MRWFIRTRDVTDRGQTPLRMIAGDRFIPTSATTAIVEYLLQEDASVQHIPDNEGNLPIHCLCQSPPWGDYLPVLQILVSNGGAAVLGARNNAGYLPLHLLVAAAADEGNNNSTATERCHSKMVKYLVAAHPGALSARTNRGDLPIALACQSDNASSGAPLDVIYTLLRGDPSVVRT